MSNNKKKEYISLGEDIVEHYLINNIKFIRYKKEYEIKDLKGDHNYSLRRADFYLPWFNLYIEFEGKWNVPDGRKRYLEKRAIYKANKKPCVFLYPDNLGTLEYVFPRRVADVLKEHGFYKKLFAFRLLKLLSSNSFLKIFLTSLILYWFIDAKSDIINIIVLIFILVWFLVEGIYKHFLQW